MSQNEVWNEKKYEKNHENMKKYENFYRSLDKKIHSNFREKKNKSIFSVKAKTLWDFFSFYRFFLIIFSSVEWIFLAKDIRT